MRVPASAAVLASDAIKLEQNAVYLVDHGNEAGARSEIKNSEQLLNKALPAADALTTPPELRTFAPPDTSWDRVGEDDGVPQGSS
jgi:hypothetical protein